MSNVEPDSEILEYAIARELDANRFYLALAERVTDPAMREVFEELADEELEHKAKLELEIFKTGRTLSPQEAANLTLNEQADYSGPELDMSYKEMLLMAIDKEEASFRTYINLLGTVSDSESREVILAIAQEEVKHKLRFETEYDLLLKKERFKERG
jgi:rubrerythrin